MALLTIPRRPPMRGPAAFVLGAAVAALLSPMVTGSPMLTAMPEPAADEYAVKSAFVFNLARFVEWPADAFAAADAPLRVCVAGDDPFGDALARALRGHMVGGRPVKVVAGLHPERRDGCHIVYLPRSEEPREAETLTRLAGAPVLTIGEGRHFPEGGGIVGIGIDDRRVRFVVNLATARRAGIKMSARLLTLATRVLTEEGR
jgi:hypothetical protein